MILDIESVVFGGEGLARHNGRVVFIPKAFPGDRVRVELVEEKSSYARARVVEWISMSEQRAEGGSPCPHSRLCGGCSWLGFSYLAQLEAKADFIRQAFHRIAQWEEAVELSRGLKVECADTKNYRNRLLLRGRLKADGSVKVGFFEQSSHKLVAVSTCWVAARSIEALIIDLNQAQFAKMQDDLSFRLHVQELPALVKGETETSSLLVTLEPIGDPTLFVHFKQYLQENRRVAWAGLKSEADQSPYFLFENWKNISYFTQATLFQQVNIALNQKVREAITDIVSEENSKSILDLFCGSGNLSLHLGDPSRKIVAVEQSRGSVKLGQYNSEQNQIPGISFLDESAVLYLRQAVDKHIYYDTLIVDPPRQGMKECLQSIHKLLPKCLIYMSCDPMTLARDLKDLKDVYKIRSVKAFDFFPHSHHVETLVHLEPRDR
ncbi:MAG: class I SAM-dependent RNA methyltransferase [Oligoflexales bacterium]|nr:class I SAM-dependent RNA methyltransferase [Oligoflexales bacterium]